MKLIQTVFVLLVSLILLNCHSSQYRTQNIVSPSANIKADIDRLYKDAQLDSVINIELFRMAMNGYYSLDKAIKSDEIIIIDYSKPSNLERFFIIDIRNNVLIFKSLVAHGKNTGEIVASKFSNIPDSKQSSLGFFITAETYHGKHGLSIRLDGLEYGINHNARKRDIVIHRADYVSDDFIKTNGRLGRSWGCPALPSDLSDEIIQSISNGKCLFIFGDSLEYQEQSKYVVKGKMDS